MSLVLFMLSLQRQWDSQVAADTWLEESVVLELDGQLLKVIVKAQRVASGCSTLSAFGKITIEVSEELRRR